MNYTFLQPLCALLLVLALPFGHCLSLRALLSAETAFDATSLNHTLGLAETQSKGPLPEPTPGLLHNQLAHQAQRRVLGRQMLDRRGTFDDEVEQYAKLFRDHLSRSKMIFYMHVSKTGGSHICSVGTRAGCRTSHDESDNCHMGFDDQDWTGWFHRRENQSSLTCSELAAQYATEDVQLEGNENYLFAGGLCPEFFNVMPVRDPIHRLMSHMNMISNFETFGWWRQALSWPENAADMRPEQTFSKLPILSDNYYIRLLLGEDVFRLPFGSITAAHLKAAKEVLDKFDLVLVLDEDDPDSLNRDLRTTLGWNVSSVEKTSHEGHPSRAYQEKLSWTGAELASVRTANALDLELWEYAKALHLVDEQVFMHSRFSESMATTPDRFCGDVSK